MNKTRALIGYTGFVGKNLDDPTFTDRFNATNIEDAHGQHFDEVLCAGVQAVKWWANKNPEEDWAGIKRLLDVLETVRADRFTLISTVDVYRDPVGVDEATPIETDGLGPYGLHRYEVERFVRARFGDEASIIRLPGLFGAGLKKNLIYDLLSGGDLSGFDAESRFQFYDLARLKDDLARVHDTALPLVNFAVEPVSVAQVAARISGTPFNHRTGSPLSYNMLTQHASIWSQDGRYMESATASLNRIAAFASEWDRQ